MLGIKSSRNSKCISNWLSEVNSFWQLMPNEPLTIGSNVVSLTKNGRIRKFKNALLLDVNSEGTKYEIITRKNKNIIEDSKYVSLYINQRQ